MIYQTSALRCEGPVYRHGKPDRAQGLYLSWASGQEQQIREAGTAILLPPVTQFGQIGCMVVRVGEVYEKNPRNRKLFIF